MTMMTRPWLSSRQLTKARVGAIFAIVLGCAPFRVMNSGPRAAESGEPITISAFGDSLTAGYGLPPGADFAAKLEKALRAKGLNVRVNNAGVSGDTTSGGLARFDWAVPDETDAVILELGANDALRGISPKLARKNLTAMLEKLKARNLPVLLAGMRAPANWGEAYQTEFDGMYADLARSFNTIYYPFFLEGVINQPKLKLADALHPNAKGVDVIVQRILPTVKVLVAEAKNRAKNNTSTETTKQ